MIIIKLYNGEEIMGRVLEENDEHIILQDALKLNYSYQDGSTAPGVFLTKYFLYVDSYDVEFMKKTISHIHRNPKSNFVKFYESFASGLKQRKPAMTEDAKSQAREIMIDMFLEGHINPISNTHH